MMELNVSARGRLNTTNQKRVIPLSLHQAPSAVYHSHCQELPVVRRKKHSIANLESLSEPSLLPYYRHIRRHGRRRRQDAHSGHPRQARKPRPAPARGSRRRLHIVQSHRRRRVPRPRSIQLPLRHGPRRKATRRDPQVGIQVRHGKPQAGRRQHLHRPSLPWPLEVVQIDDERMKGTKKRIGTMREKKIATQTTRPGASAADGLMDMRENQCYRQTKLGTTLLTASHERISGAYDKQS
ncbi:hypothetical protein CaCOL14_005390 [Colletotrichum acutatum]